MIVIVAWTHAWTWIQAWFQVWFQNSELDLVLSVWCSEALTSTSATGQDSRVKSSVLATRGALELQPLSWPLGGAWGWMPPFLPQKHWCFLTPSYSSGCSMSHCCGLSVAWHEQIITSRILLHPICSEALQRTESMPSTAGEADS